MVARVGDGEQLAGGVDDRVLVGSQHGEQAVDETHPGLRVAFPAQDAGHRLGHVPAQDLGFIRVRHRRARCVDCARLIEASLQVSGDETFVYALEQASPVSGHSRQLAIARRS
ncbi:hypothetical protein GCM10009721_32170 [Terrabacter tumescens]|uniref:Uncharacterized protein n=1 Tax=Terrabacter tumescens TaxID=60443 RepID=A0ABQ2IA15_9MICO|nr:hypothetical protein GCM10009721_32170 [Terrabacter tumescens]